MKLQYSILEDVAIDILKSEGSGGNYVYKIIQISYTNILTYYFPLTVAGTFLNTHLLSLTDALLTFATF